MKSSLGLFVFTMLLVPSLFAQQAQNSISTTIETKTEIRKKSPLSLQLDLNPLFKFNGSYGVSLILDVSTRVSAEATLNHQETSMTETTIGLDTPTALATAHAYGLRLNFYPFASVEEGGFYTSIAAAKTDLNFTQKTSGKELSDEITTRQIFAGYHFRPKMDGGLQLTSRIGAGYGNGREFVVRGDFAQYEAKDSALLDASFLITY